MKKTDQLPKEGKDFYLNKDGLFVLTEHYLLKRGFCCHNGCTHCPYLKDQKVKRKDKK